MEEANRRIRSRIQQGDETKILNLKYLNLSELPSLPNNLQILDCNSNHLHNLPNLSNCVNLQKLDCSNNKITKLHELPNTLRELNCEGNILRILPDLSQLHSLQILDCSSNSFKTLPTLPNSLQILNCRYNQLNSLPNLPNSLQILNCSNNKLTSLPELHTNLKRLSCKYNQLTELPDLPNSLQEISFENNPNLVLTPTQINFINNLNIPQPIREQPIEPQLEYKHQSYFKSDNCDNKTDTTGNKPLTNIRKIIVFPNNISSNENKYTMWCYDNDELKSAITPTDIPNIYREQYTGLLFTNDSLFSIDLYVLIVHYIQ